MELWLFNVDGYLMSKHVIWSYPPSLKVQIEAGNPDVVNGIIEIRKNTKA